MRGPFRAELRPDSQPTTGGARRKINTDPTRKENGTNLLQRKPDPKLKGTVPTIGKDRTLRGKVRRNARKAARR